MRRHLQLFVAYLAQFIQSRLSYRADFVIDIMAVLVALSVHLVFLGVVYSKVQSLQGWTFQQLLFIYGFSLIPLGFFNVISTNLWEFSDSYLIEGRFDRVLLRPVHPLFQVLFESLNLASLGEVVIGLMVVAGAGAALAIQPELLDVILFPILILSAAAVYLGVFLLMTSLSFWFEDRLGIGAPIYNVVRFARYPVNIFHPIVRVIISWVVPFAFAAFYPASHFLRAHEYRWFAAMTPLVAVIVMTTAAAVFTMGTRRYRSTGS